MTAEIAIANKSAVALAADSKVTIGGLRSAKTYDTVNKVFTLSKTHPVGIMVFGNAEFMDYPWETIVKLYRRERGAEDKDCIEHWSDDFLKYLEGFGKVAEHHRVGNLRSMVGSWMAQLDDMAVAWANQTGVPIDSEGFREVFLATIRRELARHASANIWMATAKAKKFLREHGADLSQAIEDFAPVTLEGELEQALKEFVLSALMREVDSPRSSGFVIAGFGRKEFFPTIIEHNTDGYVGAHLKIRRAEPRDISRSNKGYIGAFAQKDMVQSFMNGYDGNLIGRMRGSVFEVVRDSCMAILDTYGMKKAQTDAVREEIEKAAMGRVQSVFDQFVQDSQQTFSGPVMNMVGLLPKDELAHLAESLVALTSLKRRVSSEAETVGGPIDVALISKGDGFVWIKRKHYFRPELNPQFIRNYMADVIEKEA